MTQQLLADLRSRINPAYQDVRGTESYERKQCADAIEAMQAENERLKSCLAKANSNHEEFERKWYLSCDERDALQSQLDAMGKGDAVAYIQTQKGGEVELVWDKDEELEGALYEYAPLYAAPKALAPLTDEQIEEGRKATFSTDNPYCPCDRKTMLKAVRWAERKYGIHANGGQQ